MAAPGLPKVSTPFEPQVRTMQTTCHNPARSMELKYYGKMSDLRHFKQNEMLSFDADRTQNGHKKAPQACTGGAD